MNNDPRVLLKSHGIQVTAQRIAILCAVRERPHATADELRAAVTASIGTVSRQAVYDALSLLVERHLVRRIQFAGSPARFEDRVDDNHHHLICRDCGRTVDIDCAVGQRPCLTPDRSHGFAIDEAEVVYWGRCPACQHPAPTDSNTNPSTRSDT